MRFTLLRFARRRSAWLRFAPWRFASPRLAPGRFAPRRSAPRRLAFPRSARGRFAPRRIASWRSAPPSLAPDTLIPVRSALQSEGGPPLVRRSSAGRFPARGQLASVVAGAGQVKVSARMARTTTVTGGFSRARELCISLLLPSRSTRHSPQGRCDAEAISATLFLQAPDVLDEGPAVALGQVSPRGHRTPPAGDLPEDGAVGFGLDLLRGPVRRLGAQCQRRRAVAGSGSAMTRYAVGLRYLLTLLDDLDA